MTRRGQGDRGQDKIEQLSKTSQRTVLVTRSCWHGVFRLLDLYAMPFDRLSIKAWTEPLPDSRTVT